MTKITNKIWHIWALSLGEKASDCDDAADKVAMIRTVIALINLTTCVLISTNIILSWR